MQRKATVKWEGDLKNGSGSISAESGALNNIKYSFNTRFTENEVGTNPEELISAAHAACYSMALAHSLSSANIEFNGIQTTAITTIDKSGEGWKISEIHLNTRVQSSTADQHKFLELAQKAKEECPVSRVLNARISLEASLF